MRYNIVIPDIHQQYERLIRITNSEIVRGAEKVIFLGDYFDSFDYPHETQRTCEFLNKNIDKENWIFLIGNHDVHYFSPNRSYRCSGWNSLSQTIIDSSLSFKPYEKMRWLYREEIAGKDVMYSHAGLHNDLYKRLRTSFSDFAKFSDFVDYLNSSIDATCIQFADPYISAGRDRGGKELVGGITWVDWYTFSPIPVVDQIVGHSTFTNPNWLNDNYIGSKNVCIDTNLKHILKVELDTNAWIVCNVNELD
jgi:hypothetical protein